MGEKLKLGRHGTLFKRPDPPKSDFTGKLRFCLRYKLRFTMAFVVEMRMVANFWLRPGNTSPSNNIVGFSEEPMALLKGKTVGLFRADSGFCRNDVLEWLEAMPTDWTITIRIYPILKRWTSPQKGRDGTPAHQAMLQSHRQAIVSR